MPAHPHKVIPEHIKALYKDRPEFRVFHSKESDSGFEVEYAGAAWPLSTPFTIALSAYRQKWDNDAYRHLKLAHDIAWPDDIKTWHYWTERRFKYHCNIGSHQVITLAGGANTSKSYDCGKLSLLFWLANPSQRTVLIASTTLKDLDARIWGYVKKFYRQKSAIDMPGKLYNSPPQQILLNKNKDDTIHGMFAVPLPKGETEHAIAGLIGRKAEEAMLVVVDEATDVNPGFIDAMANWDKNPWFQLIVIGNSKSQFDPHGLLSMPVIGIDKISPETHAVWETKRGVCLYFDCYESPAIFEKDPEKKKLLGHFLFTNEKIAKDKARYGEDSPNFWRFTRGFWPPEDSSMTVLNPVLIARHEAQAKPEFGGDVPIEMLAGLDPALTADGDECILRFARLGVDLTGRWIIDFGGEDMVHVISISAKSSEPAEYQILQKAQELCAKKGVPPQNVAADVWGTGSGLGAIIKKEWSPLVLPVISIGHPTELPTDEDREIKGTDAYDRRVTELWFAMKAFVLKDHIRGLDDKACEQFCTRLYEWKARKLCIETKKAYKERLGKVDSKYRSPDRADAACLIIDLVRTRLGIHPGAISEAGAARSELRRYFDNQHQLGYSKETWREERREDQQMGLHPSQWEDGFAASEYSEEDHD